MKWFYTKCRGCSSCGMNVAGEWTLTRFDQSGSIIVSSQPITFTQSGWDFHGISTSYHIRGRVKGSWINLTMTVSGEEGEGWVALAEGSVYAVDTHLAAHLVIVADTFGNHGALALWRS